MNESAAMTGLVQEAIGLGYVVRTHEAWGKSSLFNGSPCGHCTHSSGSDLRYFGPVTARWMACRSFQVDRSVRYLIL